MFYIAMNTARVVCIDPLHQQNRFIDNAYGRDKCSEYTSEPHKSSQK
jgi:hypothetical protein